MLSLVQYTLRSPGDSSIGIPLGIVLDDKPRKRRRNSNQKSSHLYLMRTKERLPPTRARPAVAEERIVTRSSAGHESVIRTEEIGRVMRRRRLPSESVRVALNRLVTLGILNPTPSPTTEMMVWAVLKTKKLSAREIERSGTLSRKEFERGIWRKLRRLSKIDLRVISKAQRLKKPKCAV